MKNIDINALFDSDSGKKIYNNFLKILDEFDMKSALEKGALVGFSGGADSVMLLCLLKKYSQTAAPLNILAVHINHMIRGEEALRDELFSKEFCAGLGVDFISKRVDVPAIARQNSKGLEETARDVRYSEFENIIQGRNDISCIAVAHNSTDNLETVILNLMRGAGLRGMSGIAPVRSNIIRPLLYSSKEDILSALTLCGIEFVTDSTNFEIDYNRNYIRHEILPKLSHLSENPESMALRMTKNLRSDDDFISSFAEEFLSHYPDRKIPKSALSNLHSALLSRVLTLLSKLSGCTGIAHTHIEKIYELLQGDSNSFSVSVPSGLSFVCKCGVCSFDTAKEVDSISYSRKLTLGINEIPEIDGVIIVSKDAIDKSFSKVYKNAIKQIIDSDIINGELYVREKRDGDSYVYGNMTRKLKKLFNDRAMPVDLRKRTPIICDESGILWVPGFQQRDGGDKKSQNVIHILFGYK